ncbi:MAG: hypothetical protein WC807_20840 [Hyphomicrobium sp.]|jgi:hypothetical protein
MARNRQHPVFTKDDRLLQDFNDWFFQTSDQITNLTKRRQMIENLDRTNALAGNVKDKVLAELDRLDDAYGVKADGPASYAEANPQRGRSTAAYQQKRAELFTRFAETNNRIWKTRGVYATELDRALDRQEIKAVTKRNRLPTNLLEAAKSSPALQQANMAYDHLTKKPAPVKVPQRHPEQHYERA